MKSTLIILLSLIPLFVFSSGLNKLKGTWYSKDQEIIVIEDSTGRLENLMQYGKDFPKIEVKEKSFGFLIEYYSSRTDYKILYTDRFEFKVIKVDDSILVIEPSSKFSKDFFLNRGRIMLKKKEYWKSTNIILNKIFFHSSECFGTCPKIDLSISPDKTIEYKFSGYGSDVIKDGHYTGTMEDSTFSQLISLLKNCQLETLRWNNTQCCDGPVLTLILYFNNERKYLKSMLPAIITQDLLEFIYALNTKVKMKKVDSKFFMEE